MGRRKLATWPKTLFALFILVLMTSVGADGIVGWAESRDGSGQDHLAQAKPERPVTPGDRHEVRARQYTWAVSRNEKRVKVRGYVPSEEDRKTILGMIKANMPELEIDDGMRVSAEGAPPKQIWLGAVSFALVQLSQIKEGKAQLSGTGFFVEGEARTAAGYAAVKKAVATQMPMGVVLKEISLSPPVAKPFVWTAQYEQGALTIAGNVPSDAAREALLRRATELFAEAHIIDRMELAAGAPSDWASVVTLSLALLARLEAGKIDLSDTALSIEGVAPDKEAAEEIASNIKESLPKGYESKESIRERPAEKRQTHPQPGPDRTRAEDMSAAHPT